MKIFWQDLHHRDLTTTQLYSLLALRNAVFVVEQRCAYLDIDGEDLTGNNRHILGVAGGRLVACARILAPEHADKSVKIGRVTVAAEARGLQLGNRLMEQAIGSCEKYWRQQAISLSAQAHLRRFYHRLGFSAVSAEYLEDGIPHIDMQRNPRD
ncbi:putative acetyltransferase [Erwinia sp. Ejp617]|nr:GNAT family N-acetyltransferase [Erwinia sp. Ejp617]ADP13102.1 putative acetyltransferase [Erwinia sp. Ejp617]